MGFELEMEYGLPDDHDFDDDEPSELDIANELEGCHCHLKDEDHWDNHTPAISGCCMRL